jgi:hypothetical protein
VLPTTAAAAASATVGAAIAKKRFKSKWWLIVCGCLHMHMHPGDRIERRCVAWEAAQA